MCFEASSGTLVRRSIYARRSDRLWLTTCAWWRGRLRARIQLVERFVDDPVSSVVWAATARNAAVAVLSSSMMVTVALPSAIVAPVGFERTTVNASFGSLSVSPWIFTWNVSWTVPGWKVSVWVVIVKSEGALALPATVATVTVTGEKAAVDRRTVTRAFDWFLSPSAISRSSTNNCGTSLSAIEPLTEDG